MPVYMSWNISAVGVCFTTVRRSSIRVDAEVHVLHAVSSSWWRVHIPCFQQLPLSAVFGNNGRIRQANWTSSSSDVTLIPVGSRKQVLTLT